MPRELRCTCGRSHVSPGREAPALSFFSGCTLRCVFCQNYAIANGTCGKEISVERLAEIMLELQEKGAANINLVTACHFAPQVISALKAAKEKGLVVPVIYNSSGYERVETLRMLAPWIDAWLPDFKYMNAQLAQCCSHAEDYPQVAKAALAEMAAQAGSCVFDADGYIKKGVIVRHLILPGHTKDSMAVLSYLHETFGDRVCISLMNQYTPLDQVAELPPLNRKVTRREYERVLNFALDIEISSGYVQEGDTARESFIPLFDYEGLE